MSNSDEPTLSELVHSPNEMTRAVARCLTALVNEISSSSAPPPEVLVTYPSGYSSDTAAFAREQLKSWTGHNATTKIAEAMGLPTGKSYKISAIFFSMPKIDPTTGRPPPPVKFDPKAWSELVPRIKSLKME